MITGAHKSDPNGTNFIHRILVTKMFNEHKPDPVFIPKRTKKKRSK